MGPKTRTLILFTTHLNTQYFLQFLTSQNHTKSLFTTHHEKSPGV